MTRAPTISAVVAAYQAEEWIEECLESIAGQTVAPDEVVVVDDGSTDATPEILERFAGRIRVIRRANGGCPAAFNTAFAAARGDYVALCGADDIWEPRKLEFQHEALRADPEIDLLFGHALLFGRIEGEFARPPAGLEATGPGLAVELYRENFICAPTVVIRRALFERLGPFVENFGADDYEYWMRCARAGARFHYDERPLLRYRQHGGNLSAKRVWMAECAARVRRSYTDLVDARVARAVLGPELFRLGRMLADDNRRPDARRAFRSSLRHASGMGPGATLRALAWLGVTSVPGDVRSPIVELARTWDRLTGGRAPHLP